MTLECGGRTIGPGRPAWIVAELSGNHNGSLQRARELIHAAAEAGADAVKLQTYTADTLTLDCDRDCFRIPDGPWAGRRLYGLYQEASTPWEWHEELFAEARRRELACFSTPFDPTAVDFLEELGCPLYKIASFEIADLPLLRRVAATRRPVIASTGMAARDEIAAAAAALREGGCPALALLYCHSAYPARIQDMRLRNIPELAAAFGCPAGLSDHSPGHAAPVAAVVMGACVIEKHLTLARDDGGPDAAFSLEPAEFAAMVAAVRAVEASLERPASFGPGAAEAGSVVFRKSLFVIRDLPAGHRLEPADVRVIRPGHGLPPAEMDRVLGRRLAVAVSRGTPLKWDLVD